MRRAADYPVICGRRNCAVCGRWRHIIDFRTYDRSKYGGKVYLSMTCRHCDNAKERERYHNMPEEQRLAIQERTSANQKARRRRARLQQEDIKRIRFKASLGKDKNGDPLLEITPFRMWLIGRLRISGSIQKLAWELDMDPSLVTRYSNGYTWGSGAGRQRDAYYGPNPVETVSITVVDRCLTAVGVETLADLYPYLDDL